jgi:rod shape-determining protein MreD
MRRRLFAAIVVAVALVLQVIVVNRLPLPGGVVPDLVLLAVVALALVYGPLPGLVIGFCAGLIADIVPPADHTIGQYAFVFCLVGYVAGMAQTEMDRSSVTPFIAMVVGAIGGCVLYAVLGGLLGDPRITWATARHVVPLTALYDVLLSPFVLYLVFRLGRRFEPIDHDTVLTVGTRTLDRYRAR